MRKPFVALVGRPNVGKSTLFNRLIGERLSVVDDRPGTTRDRIQAPVIWGGSEFILVDTGGIEPLEPLQREDAQALAEASASFVREIRAQAEIAIAEADVLIFTVDAQAGLTAADEAVADILRKLIGQRQREGKRVPPVIVAASKADAHHLRESSVEFYKLGLGEVYPVSGLHGIGTGDLLDAVVAALPPAPVEEAPDDSVKIAIVGRPNVGKSSLFNALLGEERVIVSPLPGTTRDAIDTKIEFREQRPAAALPTGMDDAPAPQPEAVQIILIDTAGIRKRGSITPGVEKWSVLRAFKAIERSEVALLLLDAAEGIVAQDEHIAGYVLDADKGAVVVVNKWDLIESAEKVNRLARPVQGLGLLTPTMQEFLKIVQERLNFMAYVPVLFVSARTGFRTEQILPTALRVYESRAMRIATSDLMRIVRAAIEAHVPTHAGRRLKIYMASQIGVNPPTFVFHVNDESLVHFSYRRLLENRIRDEFTFLGTPIRLIFRGREQSSELARR
jgi:GTP-binding protein